MLVIGGAQAANILIAIVRMKALAVLLGPTGVGLLSLYTSLQQMASTAAGMGMGSSGVRQIAAARGEGQELSQVRHVLLTAHLVQGGVALLVVWLFRAPISRSLLGDESYATAVGLVGVAVLIALLSTAHTALLQGLRRIADLGWVTVMGALLATAFGLVAVWLYGKPGLIGFVLMQPLGTLLVAMYFTRRLPPPNEARPTLGEIWQVWKPMVTLGAAFMLASLGSAATLLLVRGRVGQELGLEAAGQFAAAWAVTMTYVGFLLAAMAADYYPRLTGVIKDRLRTAALMNDQAQLGLAIGGPILLLLIGLAPWVIALLYSSEFAPAATLLQWQTLGNVFKLASWALSFSLISAALGKTYFLLELSFNAVFLAAVWMLLPIMGLLVTAVAFVVAYGVYFLAAYLLARHIHGFRWTGLSLKLLVGHSTLAVGLLALSLTQPLLGAAASVVLALGTGLIGLRIVLEKVGRKGYFATALRNAYARIGWPLSEKNR